jgi:hypothetical protein
MATAARLLWRQYRFELASVIIGLALLTVATLAITVFVNAIRPTAACLASFDQTGSNLPGCGKVGPWLHRIERTTGTIRFALAAIPFIAGALLGSVVVSREIEHRTAGLGWSLDGARWRWLAERVIPMAITLTILLAYLALASELLERARGPNVQTLSSFEGWGTRGLPLVTRGLAAFAIAVLVGSLIARQLSALVLSCVLAAVLWLGLQMAMPYAAPSVWVKDEEAGLVVGASAEPSHLYMGEINKFMGSGLRAADGTILTFDEALAQAPPNTKSGEVADYRWVFSHFTQVASIVAGDRLIEVELREAALLAVVSVLAFGGALVVVSRRRPY